VFTTIAGSGRRAAAPAHRRRRRPAPKQTRERPSTEGAPWKPRVAPEPERERLRRRASRRLPSSRREPTRPPPLRAAAAERLHSEQAATVGADPRAADLVARLFRAYEERSLCEQRRMVMEL
jgi:hypothetical protein